MKTITKTETEVLKIEIEYARALEITWRPGTSYSTSTYVRPTTPNGYEYECTSGGQSATTEPLWPRTVAETVSDGSVTWTARAFSTNATDTISSVNIESPAGITVGTPNTSGTVVDFTVSGGTSPVTYEVSCEVTSSGSEVIEEKIEVVIGGD